MKIAMSPYLLFNGTCAEAMRLYQQILGGKLDMMKMKDAPPSEHSTPADAERILHANLAFDGGALMASDCPSAFPYEPMKSLSVAATFPDGASAKKAFEKLATGGQVTAPLTQTFFADAFGMVVDRFGTPWILTGGMKGAM